MRVTFVQNDEIVPPGRLAELLRDKGIEVAICRAWATELGDLGGVTAGPLVVLGGRMTAVADESTPWLPGLRELLARQVASGRRILGICLGAQLLAVAGGGQVAVGAAAGPERGATALDWVASEFGAVLGRPAWVFSDHEDAVVKLPPGATVLARSARYLQAFAWGTAVGLQFHPEVTAEIVRDWTALDLPAVQEALLGDYREREGLLEQTAKQLVNWLVA